MNLVKVRQLYRPKASGWVAHNGLELVIADGTRKVFHNSPMTGPTICSYEDFAESLPVTEKRDETTNLDVISQRISALLEQKRKYHVVDFNCEHAVSWVLDGVSNSPQVRGTLSGGILLGGVCWLLGGNAKQVAAAVGIGAGVGLLNSKAHQLLS
jgi:hypothetical protein